MPNLLTNVRVDTLGLVERGANKEEFFLLKSDDTPEDHPKEGLLNKVVAAVKQAFGGEQPPETKEVQMSEPVKEPEVTKTEETLKEPVAEVAKTEEVKEVVKEEPKAEERLAALEKALTDQMGLIETLKAELSKTSERAVHAEETVVEKTFLEKAQKFDGFPVATADLAKHLYAIQKAGVPAETMTFFDGLFTAVNNIVKDSGVFNELGTTEIPEVKSLTERAAAIAKDGKSFRDALLELPADVQQAYLDEQYNKITKK